MKKAAPYSPAPAEGWQPWGLIAPILALVFVILPGLPAELVLEHFHLLQEGGDPVGIAGFGAFLFLPFGLTMLLVLAWTRFVERRPLATIGLAVGGAGAFLRGHAIGLAMMLVIVLAIWAACGAHAEGFAPAFRAPAALLDIAILLFGFAVQSSAEELLFRGWLFSAVARKLGLAFAVLLSSAVFSLLHYETGQAFLVPLNVVLFSLFACCWVLRTGAVWGVMGWHAGWNWLLAVGFEQKVTGLDAHQPALLVRLAADGPEWLTGGVQGAEGSICCTIVLAGGITRLLVGLRKRKAAVTPLQAET